MSESRSDQEGGSGGEKTETVKETVKEKTTAVVTKVDRSYFFPCPHCNTTIEVASINCGVFRCGVVKKTGQQVPPHAKKAVCDRLKSSGAIHGCARPFKFDGVHVHICDYV